MEQHPVPRQITTFEFKLIGFMTLKQFIYLVVFIPLGFVIYKIFPVPILNIFIGFITILFGFALAFVPIQDRPLDMWIKNLFKRLNSPTQYLFHKGNQPVYFFENLYFAQDPHKVVAHVETLEKLNKYLASKKGEDKLAKNAARRQSITSALRHPIPPKSQTVSPGQQQTQTAQAPQPAVATKPFIAGTVKNNKKIPLPGVLIYVKDPAGTPVRLLKTNPHGVFASWSTLPPGEYNFEVKDPRGSFQFDTMKIRVDQTNPRPLEFYSKELL